MASTVINPRPSMQLDMIPQTPADRHDSRTTLQPCRIGAGAARGIATGVRCGNGTKNGSRESVPCPVAHPERRNREEPSGVSEKVYVPISGVAVLSPERQASRNGTGSTWPRRVCQSSGDVGAEMPK